MINKKYQTNIKKILIFFWKKSHIPYDPQKMWVLTFIRPVRKIEPRILYSLYDFFFEKIPCPVRLFHIKYSRVPKI